MSVLMPHHLSLQILPTVAYIGYNTACTVVCVLYVYNRHLAAMNRVLQERFHAYYRSLRPLSALKRHGSPQDLPIR